jgi:hypothetical protein
VGIVIDVESGRIDSKDTKRENRRTHGEEESGNLGKKLQARIQKIEHENTLEGI